MVSSTPRLHFTPGKDSVPIVQEAGWAPGPIWTGGKSRPHRDSIPDRPARSRSLYRLSYPAHSSYTYCIKISNSHVQTPARGPESLRQGSNNTEKPVARATTFCNVATSIFFNYFTFSPETQEHVSVHMQSAQSDRLTVR